MCIVSFFNENVCLLQHLVKQKQQPTHKLTIQMEYIHMSKCVAMLRFDFFLIISSDLSMMIKFLRHIFFFKIAYFYVAYVDRGRRSVTHQNPRVKHLNLIGIVYCVKVPEISFVHPIYPDLESAKNRNLTQPPTRVIFDPRKRQVCGLRTEHINLVSTRCSLNAITNLLHGGEEKYFQGAMTEENLRDRRN